jgi:hypothetical protein
VEHHFERFTCGIRQGMEAARQRSLEYVEVPVKQDGDGE